MIFEIKRMSDIFSTRKPYEKCFEIEITETEKAPYKSFEEYNEKSGNKLKWTQRGTNHRVLEDGCIARDFGKNKAYVMEINSLEELIAFKKDVGYEVIIYNSEIENVDFGIKIYDGYLE